jgi:hypothetical protein
MLRPSFRMPDSWEQCSLAQKRHPARRDNRRSADTRLRDRELCDNRISGVQARGDQRKEFAKCGSSVRVLCVNIQQRTHIRPVASGLFYLVNFPNSLGKCLAQKNSSKSTWHKKVRRHTGVRLHFGASHRPTQPPLRKAKRPSSPCG